MSFKRMLKKTSLFLVGPLQTAALVSLATKTICLKLSPNLGASVVAMLGSNGTDREAISVSMQLVANGGMKVAIDKMLPIKQAAKARRSLEARQVNEWNGLYSLLDVAVLCKN